MMETDALPLMLGGAMTASMPVDFEVEDVELFGDPVVDMALPPHAPPTKQLRKRVDEMRISGCCQKIAWSRQGTIASIAPDGHAIELRYLRTSPQDGSWGLSESTACSQFGQNPQISGGPVVHLAWAATGSPELAVIDAAGRVSILTFSINLNRPYSVRQWDEDPIDGLHSIVGTYWLPLTPQNKQYNVTHGPATRDENGYRYDSTFVPAFGPYHPNPVKSALLCVTASCVLKLFFPQNNNKFQDTSLELESATSSDDLATHASICSEKGKTLLIAFVTASRQLKVVRAAIQWASPHPDKQVPPQSIPLNPIMQHRSAAVTTWLQHGAGESQMDISCDQISHVEMLPSALASSNSWAPPVVLTVRTYLPSTTSPYNEPSQSIIDRWELVVDSTAQALHIAFEQVGTKAPQSGNTQPNTRLRKLEPIILEKVVISIHTMQLGKVICIAFSDGTVQYRDRLTMQEIYNEPDLSKIMTLSQANFQFTNPTPCVAIAFSPTNCSFAQVCEDGKVTWNGLKHVGPDIGSSPKDAEYAAVVAGLTIAVSTASLNQMSYDDVLAAARQFIDKPRFAYDWMADIVRMLKINVNYSEESHHDQLMRNHSLQLCLSILNHMGFRGENRARAFCGKFAMLSLNVRNIVILITIASNTPSTFKERLNPLDEPEVVEALAGCTKWALDLLAYISDCLFNLLDDPKFMRMLSTSSFSEMTTYLQEKNEVTLHLLLCSSTRGFLSAACRRLVHLDAISTKATQYYELQRQMAASSSNTAEHVYRPVLVPLSLAYQKMQQHTSSSLVKVTEFDKLLMGLGEDIRQTYQSRAMVQGSKLSQQQQQQQQQQQRQQQGSGQGQGQAQGQQDAAMKRLQANCELALLLANNPPPTFQPMLNKFFGENVRAFRAMTDPARLYFADYSILEVEDDARALQARRARHRYIDVFKRVDLGRPPQLEAGTASHGQQGGGRSGVSMPSMGNSGSTGLWRRCARCTAVMEDSSGNKPGYTFILAQQRKCSCGGSWGLLPRGSLVG